MKSLKQKQRLMIILNDQSQEKTSIKQSNITTRTSTNIGTNKQNLEELKKQTLLNILSAKGVIYTYYKNNQLIRNNDKNKKEMRLVSW